MYNQRTTVFMKCSSEWTLGSQIQWLQCLLEELHRAKWLRPIFKFVRKRTVFIVSNTEERGSDQSDWLIRQPVYVVGFLTTLYSIYNYLAHFQFIEAQEGYYTVTSIALSLM